MNLGTVTLLAGTALLFLTSIVHISKGYPRLQNAIKTKQINLPSFSPSTRENMSHEELRVIWLSFGMHLLILSAIILFLSFKRNETAKIITIILAIVPIIDASLLKAYIKGIHLGAPLLALSGLLIVIGQIIA